MHLLIGVGATVTGIVVSIVLLGGAPLWYWLVVRYQHRHSSIYEDNPWMFDEFDQDDDREPSNGRFG